MCSGVCVCQADRLFKAMDVQRCGAISCTEFREAFTADAIPGRNGNVTTRTDRSQPPPMGRKGGEQMWKFLHQEEVRSFADMTPAGKAEYRDRSRIQAALRKHAAGMKQAFKTRQQVGDGVVTRTRVSMDKAADVLRQAGVDVSTERLQQLYGRAGTRDGQITFSELAAHTEDFFRGMVHHESPRYGRRRVRRAHCASTCGGVTEPRLTALWRVCVCVCCHTVPTSTGQPP